MKKILSTIIITLFFNSYLFAQSNKYSSLIGEWIKVISKNNEFYLVDCENKSSLILKNNSILEKDVFEDTNNQIFKCIEKEIITVFINKENTNYIKFKWFDKKKKVIKVQNSSDNFIPKYYILKSNINSIKKIKATKENCLEASNDFGDEVNDTFQYKSFKINIENSNCISIKDSKDKIIFEDCYENSILKFRQQSNKILPLTIINGNKSLDLNIIQENNKWVISNAIYYKGMDKININSICELKKFDFDNYVNSIEKESNPNFQSQDIKNLQNKKLIKDLDVYKISDMLTKNPINSNNLVVYNNAAFDLINFESFNEARIILLEIVKKYPTRTVAWLNLGDAQYGFEDSKNAKISYQKYIALMKSQNKDLTKIPSRVYERIK